MIRFISFLFLCLSFATAANSTCASCSESECLLKASSDDLAEIELRLYTESTIDDYTSVLVGDALQLFDLMDNSKPTIVFVFGWIAFPDLPITKAIINAYINRGDHNVLLFNWQGIAFTLYDYAVRSLESVGCTLATALNELVAVGLNTTGMNIIGHSLGAHVCGFAGRFANFTLPRITGLDPAGPGFDDQAEPLNSTDAEFVVIIHTDAGQLGINLQTGDVDFYVNEGTGNQPGCWTEAVCSHLRAINLFAESVLNEDSLIGLSCDSYSNFEAGLCSSNSKAMMGYGTPTNASGKYYLETNSESPYGQGDNGTTYEDSDNLLESIADSIFDIFSG